MLELKTLAERPGETFEEMVEEAVAIVELVDQQPVELVA